MKKIFLLVVLAVIVTMSCRKEFDTPAEKVIPTGNIYTIQELKQWYADSGEYGVKEDLSVYLTITGDERSGNLYKTVYGQDTSGSIAISLLYSGGVYVGDYVRIYLKGTRIRENYGLLVIDSVDTDKNIIKISTNNTVNIKTVTLAEIDESLESCIIRIDSAQFNYNYIGQTFADAVTKSSKNTSIEDCDGNSIILRNSGYANFAASTIPQGRGALTAIVGEYNGIMQLYIRDINDINFTGDRCPGTNNIKLLKDFEDLSVSSGGWITKKVIGTTSWVTASFGSDNFGKITNYNGTSNSQAETWLISPSVDLSASTSATFSFDNTCNYTGPTLEVLISSNYDGTSAPSTATWTALSPTLSSGSWAWVNSGDLNLASYLGSANIYVAFKYTGTSSTGRTWEIDNIKIAE